MTDFPKLSVWGQIEAARDETSGYPHLSQKRLDEAIEKATKAVEEKQTKQAKTSREDLPLEQWRHDLETVDILLEQRPPDIERARRMIDDIQREIQREI